MPPADKPVCDQSSRCVASRHDASPRWNVQTKEQQAAANPQKLNNTPINTKT